MPAALGELARRTGESEHLGLGMPRMTPQLQPVPLLLLVFGVGGHGAPHQEDGRTTVAAIAIAPTDPSTMSDHDIRCSSFARCPRHSVTFRSPVCVSCKATSTSTALVFFSLMTMFSLRQTQSMKLTSDRFTKTPELIELRPQVRTLKPYRS
ncbi:hypothetical protein DdX_21799 [Ditylenchus destructor]|uniref:Uncharacterized protein n=1 Tax=Ditylenchus destructor TaxID=166010 RepID=A0AAD4MEE3_9BILA|nr:hypothetical protein DdX_21799 [Ditylenchus destructor]